MADVVSISKARLPQVARHAMYHDKSGVIVSPFNCTLPEAIAEPPDPNNPSKDYDKPRLLKDSEIWRACFPKITPTSHAFKPLDLYPDELAECIVPVPVGTGFMLHAHICNSWVELENSLISIIGTLMKRHDDAKYIPSITWPPWPQEYGYRNSYPEWDTAFTHVKRSKKAFSSLSASVTLSICLWLDDNEYLCFNRAWSALATRYPDPIPRAWLESLQESIVCNLEPGFRPGAFLDPYTTHWGRFMTRFVRASIPIWFIWGHRHAYSYTSVSDPDMWKCYFPPDDILEIAKTRQNTYASIILPHKETDATAPTPRSFAPKPTPSNPTTSRPSLSPNARDLPFTSEPWPEYESWPTDEEPPPPPSTRDPRLTVEKNSGQRAGEDWEAFSARKRAMEERSIQTEEVGARQSRLAREDNALKYKLSKKSTMFRWEQDDADPTFYRRKRILKADGPSAFGRVRPDQRFYWAYGDEWDLVPQLPAPPGAPLDDPYRSPDDDEEIDYDDTITPQIGLDMCDATPVGPGMVKALEEVMYSQDEVDARVYFPIISFLDYLYRRHGLNLAPDSRSWHPDLHPLGAVKATDFKQVACIFLYSRLWQDIKEPVATSIVDSFNIAYNEGLHCNQLPEVWDLRSDLKLDLHHVSLMHIRGPNHTVTYILRPSRYSKDPSFWYVALTSPTAVLLVYRSGWGTMLQIARGLLELGIPFRTVVEDRTPPPEYDWNEKSRGLGIRPVDYKVTIADLNAYKQRRHGILTSPAGRAIRLRGGLVGRIASDTVPERQVLEGPALCDEIVAMDDGVYFLDDGVSDETLDCISGVYHVLQGRKNCVSHSSWWPKHGIFMKSGRFSDQWTPDAENFYCDRRMKFDTGDFSIYTSRDWKARLKFKQSRMAKFINGSERLAREFLG
jgi:hypothetical protein